MKANQSKHTIENKIDTVVMKWKLPNYLYPIEWEISVIDDKTLSTLIQKSRSTSQIGQNSLKNEKEVRNSGEIT